MIGDLLYHGSADRVETVDLARGAPNKDFGAGFYTTTELGQAEAFARLKAKRMHAGAGWVSVFRLGETQGLRVREFARSDAEWFDFVLANRNFGQPSLVAPTETWDIVSGPVANDAVGLVLNQYVAGAFGDPRSPEAKSTAIRLLLSQRLHDQVFFGTPEAVAALELVEVRHVRVD